MNFIQLFRQRFQSTQQIQICCHHVTSIYSLKRQPFLRRNGITSLVITFSPQYGIFSSSGASAICISKQLSCMQGEDQSDLRVSPEYCV